MRTGRPPLPVGALGQIRVVKQVHDGKHPSGNRRWRLATDEDKTGVMRWKASARYRDRSGRSRTISRYSQTSGADARRRLSKAWADQRMEQRLVRPTTATTVEALSELWWSDFNKNSKARPQTKAQYRDTLDQHLIPTFGQLRVYELDSAMIHEGLEDLAEGALGRARMTRVVLKHLGAFGVRSGVFAANPVTEDIASYRGTHKPPSALTVDQYRDVRQAVISWLTDVHSGPPRSRVVLDVLDFMVATGCRTGEALALRWEDVHLGDQPSVTFAGTIVEPRKGRPTHRQEFTKTAAGFRTVPIGPMTTALLIRRAGEETGPGVEVVFPNAKGGLLAPNNFRYKLRQALKAADLEGFYPYLARKTGAKLIRDDVGIEAASQTLGHSDTAVTAKHYAGTVHDAPDVSNVLEAFLAEASTDFT